jgi:hypothetical protein
MRDVEAQQEALQARQGTSPAMNDQLNHYSIRNLGSIRKPTTILQV